MNKKILNLLAIIFMFLINGFVFANSNFTNNTATLETAEALESGKFKIAFEYNYSGDYLKFMNNSNYDGSLTHSKMGTPNYGVKAGIGIIKNLELDVKIWSDVRSSIGTKVNLKYQLKIKSKSFSVALYPGYIYFRNTDDNSSIGQYKFYSNGIEMPIITSFNINKKISIYNVFSLGVDNFYLYDRKIDDSFVNNEKYNTGFNKINKLNITTGISYNINKFFIRTELGFFGYSHYDYGTDESTNPFAIFTSIIYFKPYWNIYPNNFIWSFGIGRNF